MSISAYKRTIRESESPRQIEARVFARITGAMREHQQDWAASSEKLARLAVLSGGLRDAVVQNRRLWERLRGDLASDSNALPQALRANLLSISLWVDRTCGSVLGGGPGLPALIDVNQNILAGLSAARPAPTAVDQDGAQSYSQTL
ncbi:flagellar biosynthesis regulator FlaF [Alloyangia pacifica]|uniref:Flagellar protein FlaF n=1 Tax=Alloyangia pacifica TaxID=311180 RepID=A0A1I6SZX0_9RHOB|nr:flagellar biosynthesis regulator FlaF [Alloyangia pacifica]SDG92673.1 flagellar protein FlaF [Alloyangia pacifica]SFS82466.1 flagellar protein FlaF [Alloyangia pacifica]